MSIYDSGVSSSSSVGDATGSTMTTDITVVVLVADDEA